MPIRRYKPTSAGRRFMSVSTFEEVTKTRPEKSLLEPVTKKGGRNNNGRVTTRHQGGGHKRRYRLVDFKRRKDGVPAKVAAIEYDPNRSARIALLHYADGAKAYILAPANLRVGATVESGPEADIKVGNVDHQNISGGKAGRSRWKGKRPAVRGSAMNPVDHPHGGGEGKSKGGRHPVTPWGVPTLGKRTRSKHKESNKLIVRGRRRGKEGRR